MLVVVVDGKNLKVCVKIVWVSILVGMVEVILSCIFEYLLEYVMSVYYL